MSSNAQVESAVSRGSHIPARPDRARAMPAARLLAAVACAAIFLVLLLAAGLNADPAGHGTHTQIGLPPCGWVVATGKPCPTCGMTTAFAHAAHGRFLLAFSTQPGGVLACFAAATLFWPLLHTALTGSNMAGICGKLLSPKVLWIAGGVWLGSWAYVFVTWPRG